MEKQKYPPPKTDTTGPPTIDTSHFILTLQGTCNDGDVIVKVDGTALPGSPVPCQDGKWSIMADIPAGVHEVTAKDNNGTEKETIVVMNAESLIWKLLGEPQIRR